MVSAPSYAPGDLVEIEDPRTGARSRIVVDRRYTHPTFGPGFVGHPPGAPGVTTGGFDAAIISTPRAHR